MNAVSVFMDVVMLMKIRRWIS